MIEYVKLENGMRQYRVESACVIYRVRDEWGFFSNFAPCPLTAEVEGEVIVACTSEAIYQAGRFIHRPDLMRLTLEQKSAYDVKKFARLHINDTRPDWFSVNVNLMRDVLKCKYEAYPRKVAGLLRLTGDRPIVELSYRDTFWGAYPENGNVLVGKNVLGRLWMELREKVL